MELDAMLKALAADCGTHEVVSTGRLSLAEIDAARAEGRMYVNPHNLGFVLRPTPIHPVERKFFDADCQDKGCQALVLKAKVGEWREACRTVGRAGMDLVKRLEGEP